MIKSKSWLLILIILPQCYPKVDGHILWKAELKANGDSYELVNKFKSHSEFDMIFDLKAFSYECYYGEKIDLNREMPVIEDFKFNQIVLENEDGQRRLYSNMFFEEGEVKSVADVNCMFDWYVDIKVTKKTEILKIRIPYLSDLKVTEKDDKIRMIYLFKPTKEQKSKGYSNLILKSDWVHLK